MSNAEPEFLFGKGRNQITLKGKDAIREGGVIRWLLLARALAILVPAVATVIGILIWRIW